MATQYQPLFPGAYMEHAGMGTNLSNENRILMRTFLEKAMYELAYELNARLEWVKIPLTGIRYLINRRIKEKELGIQVNG